MKNKIILYIGLGILAVAMVLGIFVLGNGIKFAANNNTYKNGTLTERVEAAENKTEAQKVLWWTVSLWKYMSFLSMQWGDRNEEKVKDLILGNTHN